MKFYVYNLDYSWDYSWDYSLMNLFLILTDLSIINLRIFYLPEESHYFIKCETYD
jgi:hypothetical protein